MVANKVFLDPRGVNCVFCYTDTEIPLDSIITINDTPAYVSKVFTSADGWNPGLGNSNQGVIGFNYTGTGYTYGDTFVIVNSTGSVPISGYSPGPGYGYLNFSAIDTPYYFPGNYLYKGGDYFNVGTGDFTIEFYFKLTNTNTSTFLYFTDSLDYSTSNKFWIILYGGGMQYATGGSPTSFNLVPNLNEWHHFALSRASGTFYPYLDGVQGNVFEDTTNFAQMLSCFIGGNNIFGYAGIDEVYCLNGSMSNIRVTENVALYTTSSFTPPTPPLSYDANTTILLMPVSEGTKYVNSVDNETFINHDNPVTNQAVTFSAGPIDYPPTPPPPPYLAVSWIPDSTNITWYDGWDKGGSYYSYLNCSDFNTINPGIDNFSSVQGLDFNFYSNTVTSITGLEFLTELQYFSVTDSLLSSVVLSGNNKLSKLEFSNAPLTSIDLSSNLFLSSINIQTALLEEINFSNNTLLTGLTLSYLPIKTIDLTNLSLLNNFSIANTQLSSIQGLQNLDNVSYFYLNYNALSSININDMSALQYAYLENNNLTAIPLSSCPALIWLSIYNNSFTEFPDISNVTSLEILSIYSNQLREINTSYSHSTLRQLNASFNLTLSSVNLLKFPYLRNISCNYCNLSELNLGFMNRPEYIYCNNNNITSLTLPVSTDNSWSNSFDAYVVIGDNPLSTVSVSGVRTVKTLEANYCNFSTSVIDRLFNEIADNVAITNKTNGYVSIRYGSNGSPSSASLTARNFLISKNWSLNYNA